MFIYWLLFAFPAMMALAYPVTAERYRPSPAQSLALISFLLLYVGMGALRFETGGDWLTYDETFEDIRTDTFSYALTSTDPLFGLLNYISAQLGTGVYLVNAICAWVLGYGVIKVALRFREPWLAVMMAVPYLLIVVGFGYVRQGAAIGVVLIAIASFDQSRPLRTALYLAIALGFHSTAAMTFPIFAWALARRYKVFAVLFGALGAFAYVNVLAPKLGHFEAGYVDAEYDSSGAAARILMSLVPSVLLLLRWRHFAGSTRIRSVWVTVAIANVILIVALQLSPSSTAVDRIALFFSVIQLAVFGEFRDLVPVSNRMALLVRLMLIAIAAAVQVVWLVFGTHAIYWVPYKSILQFI